LAPSTSKLILRLTVSVITNISLYALAPFLSARTIHWWRAWAVIGLILFGSAWAIGDLYRSYRSVLEERLKPLFQKGQPVADRVLVSLFFATYMGLVVFIPLDVFRLRLLGKTGIVFSSLGLLLMVLGWWIAQLSLRENTFASVVVRHPQEGQQSVIDTGVYSVVRHPLYVGGLILVVGMPLWLESYAAFLLAVVPLGVISVRILFEERFLRKELPRYDAYAQKVRYRLIPFSGECPPRGF